MSRRRKATTFQRTARTVLQFLGALPVTAVASLFTDDETVLLAVQGVAQAAVTALQNALEDAGAVPTLLKDPPPGR